MVMGLLLFANLLPPSAFSYVVATRVDMRVTVLPRRFYL